MINLIKTTFVLTGIILSLTFGSTIAFAAITTTNVSLSVNDDDDYYDDVDDADDIDDNDDYDDIDDDYSVIQVTPNMCTYGDCDENGNLITNTGYLVGETVQDVGTTAGNVITNTGNAIGGVLN